MQILITIREASDRVNNWDKFCEEMGLSPWCMNECSCGDDKLKLSEETAKKFGIIKEK